MQQSLSLPLPCMLAADADVALIKSNSGPLKNGRILYLENIFSSQHDSAKIGLLSFNFTPANGARSGKMD